MADTRNPGGGEKPQSGARAEREARLAQALRNNLRRRKAPVRKAPVPPSETSEKG